MGIEVSVRAEEEHFYCSCRRKICNFPLFKGFYRFVPVVVAHVFLSRLCGNDTAGYPCKPLRCLSFLFCNYRDIWSRFPQFQTSGMFARCLRRKIRHSSVNPNGAKKCESKNRISAYIYLTVAAEILAEDRQR